MLRVLAGGLLVVAAAAAWIAWSGLRARDELTAARSDVSRLRAALVAGDHDGALRVLDDARAHAANARSLTSDPVWRAMGALPLLGRTPRAVTQSTDVLADTVDERAARPRRRRLPARPRHRPPGRPRRPGRAGRRAARGRGGPPATWTRW